MDFKISVRLLVKLTLVAFKFIVETELQCGKKFMEKCLKYVDHLSKSEFGAMPGGKREAVKLRWKRGKENRK